MMITTTLLLLLLVVLLVVVVATEANNNNNNKKNNNDDDMTAEYKKAISSRNGQKLPYIGESLKMLLEDKKKRLNHDDDDHHQDTKQHQEEKDFERKLKPRNDDDNNGWWGSGSGSSSSWWEENHDLDEILNLIITYDTDEFPDSLKDNINGNVETDIPTMHIGGYTITAGNIDDVLNDKNVLSVELDTLYYADVHERSHRSQKEEVKEQEEKGGGDETLRRGGGGGQQRKLQETIPPGLAMVQADEMALLTPGEIPSNTPEMVAVCVIDTGYDNDHNDLPNLSSDDGFVPTFETCFQTCRWWSGCSVTCEDYYEGNEWDEDINGHGTHVAGTIGAQPGNSRGVNSVLSYSSDTHGTNFKFFIGKGLSDSGGGYSSSILDAVEACRIHANGEGINNIVVNLSLGGAGFSNAIEDRYNDLYLNHNVLLVAAAGNTGDDSNHYPASYPSLMGVAAVQTTSDSEGDPGDIAYFSTHNDQTEIAAPGRFVESTVPGGGTDIYSGTSMASPHVAGVAALVWSYFPQCTNYQIRNVLLLTAQQHKDEEEEGDCNEYYGYGTVQAKAAFDLLKSRGCAVGGTTASMEGGCDQVDSELRIDTTAPPTEPPTPAPTNAPTASPTSSPTNAPTASPTAAPFAPTGSPTSSPTRPPTPTEQPTAAPTAPPTTSPTKAPTSPPTPSPTNPPTTPPTPDPTPLPTEAPPEPVCCRCWFWCLEVCC